MCGIVGIIRSEDSLIEPGVIRRAADLLKDRGPDGSGVWSEGNVALGHRRLSIIDLSSSAGQPMISQCGRYVISYNGEIYNFAQLRQQLKDAYGRWKSNSDTEVIIAAFMKWGVSCLDYFNGMFAFAIWDREDKILFAARDRMGEKPFYYHSSGKCFAFASRPKSLFEMDSRISKEIDTQALGLFLECGYIPAPFSIYTEVKKLPPAHYLIAKKGDLQVKRYWDYRHIPIDCSLERRKEGDLLDELDDIIYRAVSSRMISDVPLGAFLSGGVDSSLVVAMMAKHSPHSIKTFTIGFAEKDYDESGHANLVANHLGTEHYCDKMAVDGLLELMPKFTEKYDEPFFDHSAFPVMAVSRMAKKSVSVCLSGDGGDELFGGYHYYRIVEKLKTLFNFPYGIRKLSSAALKYFPRHEFKLLAGAVNQPDILSSFAFSRSISKDFGSLMSYPEGDRTQNLSDLFQRASHKFPPALMPAEIGMRLDAFYTLPDDYLQKVDVASMAFSLEARVPLLSHELVEWAMKLPLCWKLRNGKNKYLLRQLAYRYIPKDILDRPKQGFGVPVSDWLKGDLKLWAEERLNDQKIFQELPIDQSKVLALWKLHKTGRRNAHPLLWAALVFLNFYSKMK
jgi:asparagine synthase (glutamine-hydrolysing)